MATTQTQTCQCGCGLPAPIAKVSRGGYRRGEPKRFANHHASRVRKVPRLDRTCRTCGVRFEVDPSLVDSNRRRNRRTGIYCSLACRSADGTTTATCPQCSQPFQHWRSTPRRFCSRRCAGTAPVRVQKSCVVCGSAYDVVPSRAGKTKCCSFGCLIQYNAEKNRLKGREAKNRTARPSWRARRAEILARDNYKCRDCGTAENLTVHHIVPWRRTRDDSPHNLISLCRRCHSRVEPRSAASRRGGG